MGNLEEYLYFHKGFKDWKEALNICGEKLILNKKITQNYIDNIILNTEKFGPYYIVADEMAIAHAEIDLKNVFEFGFTWNYLNNPVFFGEKPVKHLIVLCATNPTEHQEFLKKFALMCMDNEKFNTLQNINEYKILKKFLNENF